MSPLEKSMLLVFTASVIGSLGMAFLKMGSAHLSRSIWSFLNPKLLFGIALFLFSSVFYAWGIKGEEAQLSVLYPMVALGYAYSPPPPSPQHCIAGSVSQHTETQGPRLSRSRTARMSS